MNFILRCGDCLELLKQMKDNYVDAVVTDPPAGIFFMNRKWDSDKGGRDAWVSWLSSIMKECLRVLKPGGHALVWALPRTSHWTGWALEDAGFEVREKILYLFGSGFPKSLDISKALDSAAKVEREVVGIHYRHGGGSEHSGSMGGGPLGTMSEIPKTAPATDAAKLWAGYGTALKPACEDWWLCRKPLSEKTVAWNVLKHRTGALNIDGCRVETSDNLNGGAYSGGVRPNSAMGCTGEVGGTSSILEAGGGRLSPENFKQPTGRWPANLIHDGSDEVLAGFPETTSGHLGPEHQDNGKEIGCLGKYSGREKVQNFGGDSGSAARFFYCAKASRSERNAGCENLFWLDGKRIEQARWEELNEENERREKEPDYKKHNLSNGNVHPTVKCLSLMKYLIRLVTPPNGIVLDPFMGSGSTGVAAILEGKKFIGIEKEEESFITAKERIEHYPYDKETK